MRVAGASILILLFAGGMGCAASTCTVPSFGQESTSGKTGVGDARYSSTSVAQSFVLTTSATLASVGLKLEKAGSLADAFVVTLGIYSDSSGSPATSSSPLASGTLTAGQISSAGYYSFQLSSALQASAGTYWLVLSANYGQPSATDLIYWYGFQGTTDGYTDGVAKVLTTTPAWTNTPIGALRDLTFSLSCQ